MSIASGTGLSAVMLKESFTAYPFTPGTLALILQGMSRYQLSLRITGKRRKVVVLYENNSIDRIVCVGQEWAHRQVHLAV